MTPKTGFQVTWGLTLAAVLATAWTISAQGDPKLDLAGEWAIQFKADTTAFGTEFTEKGTFSLKRTEPGVFMVADENAGSRAKFFLEGNSLKFRNNAGNDTATGKMTLGPNGVIQSINWSDGSVFTRTGGTGGTITCPATFEGEWRDWGAKVGGRRAPPPPGTEGLWGTWILKQNGNNVTGTVPKIGERFGPADITATVSGRTFAGTWTAPGAKGTLNFTRTADDCTLYGKYSIDEPQGERGGTFGQPTENLGASGHGGGNPWETPEGKECFEKWIAEAIRKLNTSDLGHDMNANKPYSFNQYGHLLNKFVSQPNAPDAWEVNGRNKYKYMWEYWNTDATAGQWRGTGPDGFGSDAGALKKAGVPTLRDYVRNCAPGSTPGTTTAEPPLGDGMRLWTKHYTVERGKTVVVKVYLSNAKNVRNLDFSLKFLPNKVEMKGQPVRGAVVKEYAENNLERPGLMKFNFAQLSPLTLRGDSEVAGFTFEGVEVGRTPLDFELSLGNKLPITTNSGSIQVHEGPHPPGTQWPPTNPTQPGGGREPTCSGTDRWNITDAQCCLQMWVGLKQFNSSMDINRDTFVDSNDALIIMDVLAARGEYRPAPR